MEVHQVKIRIADSQIDTIWYNPAIPIEIRKSVFEGFQSPGVIQKGNGKGKNAKTGVWGYLPFPFGTPTLRYAKSSVLDLCPKESKNSIVFTLIMQKNLGLPVKDKTGIFVFRRNWEIGFQRVNTGFDDSVFRLGGQRAYKPLFRRTNIFCIFKGIDTIWNPRQQSFQQFYEKF